MKGNQKQAERGRGTVPKPCSRCGGTGSVSRGSVVNGVCFACAGDGKHRPGYHAQAGWHRIIQYVLVDAGGRELALNTDKAAIERYQSTLTVVTEIKEKVVGGEGNA